MLLEGKRMRGTKGTFLRKDFSGKVCRPLASSLLIPLYTSEFLGLHFPIPYEAGSHWRVPINGGHHSTSHLPPASLGPTEVFLGLLPNAKRETVTVFAMCLPLEKEALMDMVYPTMETGNT
ncbi:uncharacterized protein LOC143673116 [Tamandua tetradactyla]|uniref:uncharacterized protein LOC143673116 n=1 Tax=Tamandua tetradactyla TaxID=48850 RepID=UPI0040539893